MKPTAVGSRTVRSAPRVKPSLVCLLVLAAGCAPPKAYTTPGLARDFAAVDGTARWIDRDAGLLELQVACGREQYEVTCRGGSCWSGKTWAYAACPADLEVVLATPWGARGRAMVRPDGRAQIVLAPQPVPLDAPAKPGPRHRWRVEQDGKPMRWYHDGIVVGLDLSGSVRQESSRSDTARSSVETPPTPREPRGGAVKLGFGLGPGGFLCDGCSTLTGVESDLHGGLMLTERLAVLGELQVTFVNENEGQRSQAEAMVAAQLWVTPSLWTKLGFGHARVDHPDEMKEDGVAWLAAAGYEVWAWRRTPRWGAPVLELQVRLTHTTGLGNDLTSASMGLSLTVHGFGARSWLNAIGFVGVAAGWIRAM
jgi:hypothetical protein